MNKILIGQDNIGGSGLPYENALICYVYGRATLNTDGFVFLLPSIFLLFHQAIEVSVKTLLEMKGVPYPNRGMEGHKTYLLLQTAVNSNLFSKNINELLSNTDLIKLLQAMDASYLNNKYEYPGYSLVGVPLRELVDTIIYAFFEEINLEFGSKKHALAYLNVPGAIEKLFQYKLAKPFLYRILNQRTY